MLNTLHLAFYLKKHIGLHKSDGCLWKIRNRSWMIEWVLIVSIYRRKKKSYWKSKEKSFVERKILYQMVLERSLSTVFKFLKKSKQKWPV
jgi:hypothetical protein